MSHEQDIGELVDRARTAAGLSQRTLADHTGIPQTSLSRIISGTRPAKLPELILIARATGCTLAELTGTGDAKDRVQLAARATNGSGMDDMRQELLRFVELDDYLRDQAIC